MKLLVFSVLLMAAHAQVKLAGTNLAGADFGEGNLPGVFDQDYTYPTPAEIDYFVGKGMNVFRIPFRWERLQQQAFAEFNGPEQGRLTSIVNYATLTRNASVILDPHNYARYYGGIIGEAVPRAAFFDFWERLATLFIGNPNVIFGLVNEPNTMATELWLDAANAGIEGIRNAGADQLILVPGNAWSGAHSWLQDWYGTPNAIVMDRVVDPNNNYGFDMHQYFDADFSGTSPICIDPNVFFSIMQDATDWLRQRGLQAVLGEFGSANNPNCDQALENLLTFMDQNNDAWLGWTWWAAGPWWGEYMYTIEPTPDAEACPACQDRPQMAVLERHFP